ATALTHGEAAAREAQAAARALFQGGRRDGGDGLSAAALAAVPQTAVPRAELAAGLEAVDLFARSGLCSSKADARRLIHQGGAHVNEQPVARPDAVFTVADLRDGALLLRKGKKGYHRIVPD